MKSRDGKFHKLRVTMRRKGVRLQTKTGYYAWPDSPDDLEQAAIVLAHPFEAGEIGLRATVSIPDAKNPGGTVNIRIEAGNVALMRCATRRSNAHPSWRMWRPVAVRSLRGASGLISVTTPRSAIRYSGKESISDRTLGRGGGMWRY